MAINILAITSHYPPYHLGGYELRSQDIIESLESKGYSINVLTSRYGLKQPRVDGNIYRFLHLEPSANLFQRIIWDISDLNKIKRQISKTKPDLIYLFHMCELARTIFPFLAEYQIPVIYDEGGIGLILAWHGHGGWLSFCERQGKYRWKNYIRKIICKSISISTCRLLPTQWKMPKMQVYFNSEYSLNRTKNTGVSLDNPKVIYSGLNLSNFPFRVKNRLDKIIRFVIPGRIEDKKGVDEAIRSIYLLKNRFPNFHFSLTIIGPIQDFNYYSKLDETIRELHLQNEITFSTTLPHEKMYEIYQAADFCLLLTQFESFSRVPIEAMACGSVMICSNVGGNIEVIIDHVNGFLLRKDIPESICKIFEEFISNPELINNITQNARRFVEINFALPIYINKIETLLTNTIENYPYKN